MLFYWAAAGSAFKLGSLQPLYPIIQHFVFPVSETEHCKVLKQNLQLKDQFLSWISILIIIIRTKIEKLLILQATEDNQHPQANGSIWIATTFVTITILDVNDNGPEFTSATYNVTVDENTQQGVPINLGMPINAYDSDQVHAANLCRFKVVYPFYIFFFKIHIMNFQCLLLLFI